MLSDDEMVQLYRRIIQFILKSVKSLTKGINVPYIAGLITYIYIGNQMKSKKITYRQILDHVENLESQVLNNQQAIYNISAMLTDYVEMRGKAKALDAYMNNKRLGLGLQIPTCWSEFIKSIKNRYLQIKKKLDY